MLRPGGLLVAGDRLRGPEPFSADMECFFELEGLTYHMETLDRTRRLLADAGFEAVEADDTCEEYRAQPHWEYAQMPGPWRERMRELLGEDEAAHFVENWRMLTVVLDRGEWRLARLCARRSAVSRGVR